MLRKFLRRRREHSLDTRIACGSKDRNDPRRTLRRVSDGAREQLRLQHIRTHNDERGGLPFAEQNFRSVSLGSRRIRPPVVVDKIIADDLAFAVAREPLADGIPRIVDSGTNDRNRIAARIAAGWYWRIGSGCQSAAQPGQHTSNEQSRGNPPTAPKFHRAGAPTPGFTC